jgi:trypsin
MLFKHLSLALALPALSVAAPTPQDSSIQIVGGQAATAGQFPYIVSLQVSNRHYCGGSLLNADTIITAAHCATYSASSYSVRAGSLQWASGGVTSRVSQVIRNPSYSGNDNDIAIMKLSTPIAAGGNIAYVSLPSANSDPASGSSSTVAGWGATSQGGSGPAALRYVTVPIVSRATCRNQYGTSSITNNMVCAAETSGGKDSCQGDSGGPLVATGTSTLIGIVSWGNGCALRGYSGVYTRTSTQISFINQYA